MAQYQHSETFASLKNTKELKTNYTTYQYLHTLDHFIESAIDPIATAYPDFLDNYFAKVVAWQTTRPNVKFSRNHKDVLPALLFNSLTTEGAAKRVHQKSMMMNRGVLFGAVSTYLRTVNSYMKLHDPSFRLKRSKRKLLIALGEQRCGSPYLHAATLQVQYWINKAHGFKELIVQKYIRLALNSARRTYTEIEYEIKLDDIIQTYMIYLSKAIDRCDSRQGVLTTFIQTWFYSARSEIQKSVVEEHHTSYEELVSSGALTKATSPDNNYEAIQHIAATAKTLDRCGSLRYALGIPEFFTSHEVSCISHYL